MVFRLLFFLGFVFLVELYSFQTIKTLSKLKWVHYSYITISIVLLAFLVYSFSKFDRSIGQTDQTMFTMGVFLLFYVPKMILGILMFSEDIFRLLEGVLRYGMKWQTNSTSFLPNRRMVVSQIALFLALIPFVSLLYGMAKGKYNFKVYHETLYYKDLPASFDGTKIVHISDIHSGSFDNPEKIEKAIDLINQQNADLILFTGDIVNSLAKEMEPWIGTFQKIKEPTFGKFSVLGNHDYGEYLDWKGNQQAKEENFENIQKLHQQIGFQLLNNASASITKDNESIQIIGVENWGHNFKKAGDLKLASTKVNQTDFKILLSHDPSHWEYEVKNHPNHYHLTLSGHTHGMQFGIEIPGILQWSPVQYVYKQWAGLYEFQEKYLYVNRGFGFHAYPGRVGIWPEITVIELKKGEKK